MDSAIPRQSVPVEVYADIQDALGCFQSHMITLPGGGAEALFEYLTCSYGRGWKCGKFVCYKHNPEFRPLAGEKTVTLAASETKWGPPVPRRVIQRFVNGLVLVVE